MSLSLSVALLVDPPLLLKAFGRNFGLRTGHVPHHGDTAQPNEQNLKERLINLA
jgi:hypothetical protein